MIAYDEVSNRLDVHMVWKLAFAPTGNEGPIDATEAASDNVKRLFLSDVPAS